MTFAFYTPPSLVRTPSDFIMNTLPSLPTEILSSWSVQWRQPKSQSPYSSPRKPTVDQTLRSNTTTTTLPPIAFLERQLSDPHTSHLIPSEDVPPPHYTPPTRLPPMLDFAEHIPEPAYTKPPPVFSEHNAITDWFDFTQKRSAHFIAEKTCEMICYLWFTTSHSSESESNTTTTSSSTSTSQLFNRPTPATTLQLVASPTFVSFMQKLLETTQVSQSVIVLSLHYIYKLKERNRSTPAQAGSEFRIAVAGLMMANKFLDDNTYTNKTWSDVSGIELAEINRMEREFLMGVDCNLYVDKPTYESWLNLLKGLVLAKERDSRHYHKSRSSARASRHPGTSLTNTPHKYANRGRASHRARSTSPEQSHRPLACSSTYPQYISHVPAVRSAQPDLSPLKSGAKRTAGAAFSPTSATFSHVPAKRPVSISLLIPESGSHNGPNFNSPLEGLQSFARMSIDSPNAPGPHSSHATTASASSSPPSWSSSAPKEAVVPETLSTAYALDERRRSSAPQNLYFYSLACSPTDDEENRSRKGRLRYHQPPPPSSSIPYYQPRPSFPVNVQSASTSPVHTTAVPPTLPHFHDTNWTRQPAYDASSHSHYNPPQPPPPPQLLAVPSVEPPRYQPYHHTQPQSYGGELDGSSPIQSAPFANAGPPGFQFCPTPEQGYSPAYERPHRSYAWSRRSICE
ncbi:cyclin-domain-containing protein [Lentinula raphanica]|uniref:Cyclin-domain-containing protein n=1 Tax=Lentinula raphanica TaxID=153919 RepID=A0AA38PBB8_9AGAR|nr:cyclin-domain-containing protein [Lentinula raphanica]KAJ3839763.1 cyclin-domain-containing protein [Lentinula raphanica]